MVVYDAMPSEWYSDQPPRHPDAECAGERTALCCDFLDARPVCVGGRVEQEGPEVTTEAMTAERTAVLLLAIDEGCLRAPDRRRGILATDSRLRPARAPES